MRILRDFQGLPIRLTDERLAHILEHPEMVAMESAIEWGTCVPHGDALKCRLVVR
jgi:hypothetical protein